MLDRHGAFAVRVGDMIDTDQRPYPVMVIEILEESGSVRFVDRDGVEDIGRPGLYAPKYKLEI